MGFPGGKQTSERKGYLAGAAPSQTMVGHQDKDGEL